MKKINEVRILVIDDSTTNLVLLDALLKKEGYQVDTALSAREGMKMVQENKPDLIFLDILMPEATGFDFLESINEHKAAEEIPVIIVTAVGNEENMLKASEMGAVDFISKPVDIDHLLHLVRRYIRCSSPSIPN